MRLPAPPLHVPHPKSGDEVNPYTLYVYGRYLAAEMCVSFSSCWLYTADTASVVLHALQDTLLQNHLRACHIGVFRFYPISLTWLERIVIARGHPHISSRYLRLRP
jgi:hypothetical protein